MNAAQLDFIPDDLSSASVPGHEPATPFALKQQVAEKVAAHRARRTPASDPTLATGPAPNPARPAAHSRSAHIAAAVAERYAQSQSYRAFLAAEAERSVRSAQAAADIALINAQAIAGAQRQMLEDLEIWPSSNTQNPASTASPDAHLDPSRTPPVASHRPSALDLATFPNFPDSFDFPDSSDFRENSGLPSGMDFAASSSAPAHELRPSDFTVRLYETVDRPRADTSFRDQKPAGAQAIAPEDEEAERLALDDEIAFRQSPTFEGPSGAPVALAANLIEFPRQLVAPRKARPRLAEGPLREDRNPTGAAQLRIFEVEAHQISPAPANESVTPEWSSILLAAQPNDEIADAGEPEFSPALVPQTATLSRRMLSSAIDAGIVLASSLIFGAVALTTETHLAGAGLATPATISKVPLPLAAIVTGITVASLAVLYQILCFTLSDSTPGMRCARIALCTFGDENPTRQAMRRRVWAILLSGLPLGIGFFWAWLDDAGLSWHDRISRMYQRSY